MRTLILIAVFVAPLAHAADDRPARGLKDKKLEAAINIAIARGVDYLKQVQGKDGSWTYDRMGKNDHATGGLTALALYALAASGVPEGDKAIKKGVLWTERNKTPFVSGSTYGTYSASLLVLALTRINEQKHRARIHRLADSIVKSQLDSDMWTYRLGSYGSGKRGGGRRVAGAGDNSNSQIAILALWAAYSIADFDVPARTWQRIQDFYKETQEAQGGWNYRPSMGGPGVRRGPGGHPSMTAAGLVAYVYASAALNGAERALVAARRSKVATRGLKALGANRYDYANYYFVYALERVGTVMELPLEDWYIPGARALLRAQTGDGSWQEGRGRHGDSRHAYATSLALLFLSRTTLPPRRAAVTERERFPDLSDPAQLPRGFDYYLAYKPEQRASVLPEFAKAGPAAIGHFIERLADKRETVRVTAFELLEKLLDKRLFFEPTRPLEEREIMLGPIRRFWKEHGASLRWDAGTQRFRRPARKARVVK